MAYVTADARQGLLDDVAQAIEELGVALAALGAAYEVLDEASGDRLEEGLFRPVQAAYGRAQRTHAAFAARYGLPGRSFAPASAGGDLVLQHDRVADHDRQRVVELVRDPGEQRA